MGNIESIFGSMVFSDTVMRSLLPHDTYENCNRPFRRAATLIAAWPTWWPMP